MKTKILVDFQIYISVPLKVCEGDAYSEKQYFVFFTAVFKEYTGSKCLYKYI